jgi:DNA repair exonuclease SbcCD ATPase subunit
MIPQRVFIKGFLSFRDEQEIRFDNGTLWMLAGPNGSGKSAVFDVVTYALFGQHRGGKQNARELINKESDGLVVEFDFALDGQRHQVRRTLRQKSGRATRQIFRWTAGAATSTSGEWEALPDTNYENGFNDWVRQHIGLTYETFTSSVLLLQGKAEKLLSAEPVERFRVLASILDLGRYEQLHERAEEHRRTSESTAKALQKQLDILPEVSEAERQAANQRIAAAETARQQIQEVVERWQRLEVLAEHWARVQGQLGEVQQQWQRAQELFGQAADIERDWTRLRELCGVLPHLEAVVKQRTRLEDAVQAAERLAGQRQQLIGLVDNLDRTLDQTRQKRDTRRQAIAADEQREQAVGLRLRELAGVLVRVAPCERQRQELARLEARLAELPADLPTTLQQVQEENDRLSALAQALPLLRRMHGERAELQKAREIYRVALQTEKTVTIEVERGSAELVDLASQTDAAVHAHQQARERAAELRALLKEASDQLEQFRQLAGAKICRQCGQPLTAAHFDLEQTRRERERETGEVMFRQADEVRKAAAREEKQFLDRKKAVEEALANWREQAQIQYRRQEQVERDAQRHVRECAQVYHDLAEPFRSQVSPQPPASWGTTVYPTAAELADAQSQVGHVEAVRRRLADTKTNYERWNALQVQCDASRRALEVLQTELPADLSAVQAEHGELATEETALQGRLTKERAKVREEQDLLDSLTNQRQGLSQQLAATEQQGQEQQIRRQACQEALDQASGLLPAAWQPDAASATVESLGRWQAEQQTLEAAATEARARELEEARAGLEALSRRRADLEHEGETIPPEGRCEPAAVRARVTAAKQELLHGEVALIQARQDLMRLDERQRQRDELGQQFRAADRQQMLYHALTEHLGRKGLQLHLMRRAERGVLDFANAVLDRLSGGQFCLRLRGQEEGDTDQALHLEAYDRQRGQVFGLPFLSGSQRFRVAVSLALGVGQYASRQHRPIESVIIDEGFGCLDREGRQVMIQELQNLRSQLRCILLVSHQDEFADAFADGYRFELSNGTTAVSRFQR